ncbi:MAG TPA: MBOAT family protein [Kiritimatiellia bacterium]|nr:MBOAT family protein [Kiritimatiellia bacterium]
MVFSSITFLFVFLPVALAAYYACPERHRNAVALAASLFFYAWGAPRFVLVLVASSLLDYVLSRELPAGRRPERARRWILGLAVALNVSLLLYFKYANFFVDNLNAWLGRFGAGEIAWTAVALPIGISFFTFQKVSYLADVYRGTAQVARNAADYLLYVVLFPQLIAGPIVRYHDVAQQLIRREHTRERFFTGILRFCQGLGKKVLVANAMAEVADAAFGAAPGSLACGWAWLGAVAYAFQIYFDFSGYSDMAIGLGRLMGIEFLENFNRPYVSRSITEFWRRWHISLSNFMREYLYVPLGGNRKGAARTYLNLWLVFLVSGFWHGAAWNFVAWGAYHGFFLCLDKLTKNTRVARAPAWVGVPVTFVLVLFSWVLFRADSLAHAVAYAGRMLAPFGAAPETAAAIEFGWRHQAALLAAVVLCFGPAVKPHPFDFMRLEPAQASLGQAVARFAVALGLLVWSAATLATSSFNPFIYFRF